MTQGFVGKFLDLGKLQVLCLFVLICMNVMVGSSGMIPTMFCFPEETHSHGYFVRIQHEVMTIRIQESI